MANRHRRDEQLLAWTVLICLAVVFGLLALEAMFA